MLVATRTLAGAGRSLFLGLTMVALPLAAFAWADDARPDPARVEAWIEELGSPSLDAREEAWNKLRGLGADARDALEAAAGHADVSVRFSARRLLERIEESGPRGSMRRPPGTRLPPLPRLPLGSLDLDDPASREFHDDMEAWQNDIDSWLEDLLGRPGLGAPGDRDDLGRGWRFGIPGGPQGLGPTSPGLQSESASTSLQISPDGSVKVKIRRQDGDDAKEETYEAPSLEAFVEQYPDVARQAGLAGPAIGISPFLRRGIPGSSLRDPRGRGLGILPAPGADPALDQDGPRLGVQVRVLSKAQPLDVSGEVITRGLLVDEVVPASLAKRVGVSVGDVVVKVGRTEIGQAEDVRQALLELGGAAEIEVTVLRDGKEKVLRGAATEDRRG